MLFLWTWLHQDDCCLNEMAKKISAANIALVKEVAGEIHQMVGEHGAAIDGVADTIDAGDVAYTPNHAPEIVFMASATRRCSRCAWTHLRT